jgi:AGCS family alanine or glycine:cation symporter
VIYSIIAIGFIFLGTLLSNDLVWELTDFFNYLMVIPNVLALVPLCAIVAKASKSNDKKLK